jgi:hypothetical protein
METIGDDSENLDADENTPVILSKGENKTAFNY